MAACSPSPFSVLCSLNQTILTNIGMNCFLKQLEKLSEEEILEYLEAKALEEAKK